MILHINYKNIIINDINLELNINTWINWSDKSNNIPFISTTNCIGNGEEKLACELNIKTKLGGQNNTVDLVHPNIGDISVKDMTNDDCTLGTEGCQYMRTLFRKTIYPLSCWVEKYHLRCEYARYIYNMLNTSYGSSRITIFQGIEDVSYLK